MGTQVQWRGGTTEEHQTFTGASRETSVDIEKKRLLSTMEKHKVVFLWLGKI